MTTPASSSSTSASHSSGTAPAFSSQVKREAPSSPVRSPPRTRARARGIVINEPASPVAPTPPSGHLRLATPKKERGAFSRFFGKKVKTEPGNAAVLAPRTTEEEEILLKIATQRSLEETTSLPEEEARWSLDDWRKTEVKRQQRLLNRASNRRSMGREEAGVIVLDSDDEDDSDEGYEAFLRRFRIADDGQGCSSAQPSKPAPPSDSDDDGDGDYDYTVFYSQLGIL